MFDVSMLFIQCNTNSCCEHAVAGFNMYLCVFQSIDPCLCCVWGGVGGGGCDIRSGDWKNCMSSV